MRVKESSFFWSDESEQDYISVFSHRKIKQLCFFFWGWGTSETNPRSRWNVFWIPHDVRFQQGARLQMSKDWSKEVAEWCHFRGLVFFLILCAFCVHRHHDYHCLKYKELCSSWSIVSFIRLLSLLLCIMCLASYLYLRLSSKS